VKRKIALIVLSLLVVSGCGGPEIAPSGSAIVVDTPTSHVREHPMGNGVTCYVYSGLGGRGGISCVDLTRRDFK
jgi:hypothetical protein